MRSRRRSNQSPGILVTVALLILAAICIMGLVWNI